VVLPWLAALMNTRVFGLKADELLGYATVKNFSVKWYVFVAAFVAQALIFAFRLPPEASIILYSAVIVLAYLTA
jgi:hypothetical protein